MTKIEIARLQKGITRQELANRLGITERAVLYYESAQRQPRAHILKKNGNSIELQNGRFDLRRKKIWKDVA